MAHVIITTAPTREQTVIGGTPTSTTSIGYEFFESDGSDVEVYIDAVLKTDPTDYSIDPITGTEGGFAGGTINWVTPQSNVTITSALAIPFARSSDFPNTGAFNIQTLNTQLDKLWSSLKQVQEQLDRKSGIAITDTMADPADVDWPALAARLSKVFSWDANGKAEAITNPALAAAASAAAAAADLVLTNADVVLTGIDATATAADAVSTAADVVLTAADVVLADAARVLAQAAASYDIAFSAGFVPAVGGEDLVVATYGQMIATRSGSFTDEEGYIDTIATGAAVIVDVEKNGTTIYATKPQFAVSTNAITNGTLKTDGTEDFVAGDRINFKVTQIGSTIAGQNVRFTVKASFT